MALTTDTFTPMSAQGNSNAPRSFSYGTEDAAAVVEAAGYFNILAKKTGGYGLEDKDFIFSTMSDATKVYQVGVDSNGAVTLDTSLTFA